MHRAGKWARQILALQDEEGKWGWFHSLSQFSNSSMTTEQALRRLEVLGFTIEDRCIQKAVSYMDNCLSGIKAIPDRREKVMDWDVFSDLILSTWIRRFTLDNTKANLIAERWTEVITYAFCDGKYDHDKYISAYKAVLKPKGGRIIHFPNFYPVSLLCVCLDEGTELEFVEYLLNGDCGIYYIYDRKLADLPVNFKSKDSSRYIGAIELLAAYPHARHKLQFVADWLMENREANGGWDMGKLVNDKVYFPLSDDWRKQKTREADCTERILRLLGKLSDC